MPSREPRVVSCEPVPAGSHLTTHDPRLSTLVAALRQLLGMPDYQLYLAHMHERHPGETPLSERDYFTTYLESRYADGPNRCC